MISLEKKMSKKQLFLNKRTLKVKMQKMVKEEIAPLSITQTLIVSWKQTRKSFLIHNYKNLWLEKLKKITLEGKKTKKVKKKHNQ